MPFYLRKGKKLGPLRINLSKSGVGASLGVKGARVAVGPRGTIVNIGRGGAYYRKSLGRPTRDRMNGEDGESTKHLTSEPIASVVETADVEELIDSSSDELIAELNGPRGNWLRRILRLTPPVELIYELDPAASETFKSLQGAIQALMRARSVWLVESIVVHGTPMEQKYNAGAGRSLKRRRVAVGRMATTKIETNVDIFGVNTGLQELLFFPDRLLIRQRGKYAAIPYPEIKLAEEPIRFVENETPPPDAEVLGYAWQYANKTGGPDRRFSNNRQFPILLYEAVTLTSARGLNLALQVSSPDAAKRCCSLMASAIEQIRDSAVSVDAVPHDRPAASDVATAILTERAPGWEFLYFHQLLADEIDSSRFELRTSKFGIKPLSVSLAVADFSTWFSQQNSALIAMLEKTNLSMHDLPVAFGPVGSPGNPEKIQRVAAQLGDAYRYALQWPLMCRSIRTDSRWSGVLREIGLFTSTLGDEIPELALRLANAVPDAIRRAEAGEPVDLEFALDVAPVDMDAFQREMDKARRAFG